MEWVYFMGEKRLTETQFRRAIERLNIEHGTIEVARAVLVEGRKQSEVAALHGRTKGAISQSVARVWEASLLQQGHERVSAILPARQAYIVRKWAKEASKDGSKDGSK